MVRIKLGGKWFGWGILAALLIVGAYLRLTGLFHGLSFHPDERHMIMVTESLKPQLVFDHSFPWVSISGMNPHSFAYGSLPYYLNRFSGEALGLVFANATSYDNLFIIGRVLCLVFGLAGILLLYRLGQNVYNNQAVSLVAAALLTFNVFHIQLSHFFTVDVVLTTITLLALLKIINIVDSNSIKSNVLAGICIGLAISSKFSGMFLWLPFGVAVLCSLIQSRGSGWFAILCKAALGPLAAILIVAITQPYSVLEFAEFWRQVKEQTDMARGLWRPPYTVQYAHTAPYIYPATQMLFYTMGIPVLLSALAGAVYVIFRVIAQFFIVIRSFGQGRDVDTTSMKEVILLSWVFGMYLTTAGFIVKFPRYLLPIYPELLLFAALGLVKLGAFLQERFGEEAVQRRARA